MAKMTLIGMYNFDSTLFDGLSLPEGIEKDLVVDQILERSGEFEALYANLDFMKQRISMWGRKHHFTFDKWIKALNIEYDPLNNYDRKEEYEDIRKGKENGTTSGTGSSSSSGSTSPAATTSTNTNEVSAYDSSSYQPHEKNTNSLVINAAGTDSSSSNSSTSSTDTKENEETIKHKSHLYGNIGVTTSQQMLQSELDIARFNIYGQIADLFVQDFCIMLY